MNCEEAMEFLNYKLDNLYDIDDNIMIMILWYLVLKNSWHLISSFHGNIIILHNTTLNVFQLSCSVTVNSGC